ncbi:thermonuclease family protein [Halomonas garicola]|uniref:thermonuclease family protein n=1 Tax=Halomonas garicola TaxID=1690008 RepID=UPI0028A1E703|nr:thermonuclease family protein [Halomonas garicola]
MDKTRTIYRSVQRGVRYIRHRRIVLFWGVAAASLSLPWIWPEFAATGEQVATGSGECRVLKIYDGDTITVSCSGKQERVRLYCIDTPEMEQRPWGQRSRDHLRQMMPQRVRIIEHDRDQYGRLVGEVMAGQTSLNLAMVEAGQAAMYPQYCSEARYRRANEAAREAGRGVWAEPGLQQRPWEWR